MPQQLHRLSYVKGDQNYLFTYTDETRDQAKCKVGEFAHSKEHSLNWEDAARITWWMGRTRGGSRVLLRELEDSKANGTGHAQTS